VAGFARGGDRLLDVRRVARSRGARLPAPYDDESSDATPEEDPGT
jgi:hypothetical protein